MSNAILQGGASGSGSVTLLAPNTNSTQTLTLPDATGTLAQLSDVIGINQTWQTVTRNSGTTYTNATGKAITAFITFSASTSNSTMSIVIGGVTLSGLNQASGLVGSATVIIPPGATYVFTVSGTGLAMAVQELR